MKFHRAASLFLAIGLLVFESPSRAADADPVPGAKPPGRAPDANGLLARPLPPEILLWPEGAPGSEGKTAPEVVETSKSGERQVSSVHKPSVQPFLPPADKATGAAVLVIPGGGHRTLCVDHEGVFVAQRLVEHGIAAFVLKYRLAREPDSTYTIERDALGDTQRAIRLIRSKSAEWKIDPARLGAMGFSAGGELAALAAMAPGSAVEGAADPIDRFPARPSFQVLVYPGKSEAILPGKDAPPAFILCSAHDRKDISEGLAEAYLRFKRAGAAAELHIYDTGGHGFGVRPGTQGPLGKWPEVFVDWLRSEKFLGGS